MVSSTGQSMLLKGSQTAVHVPRHMTYIFPYRVRFRISKCNMPRRRKCGMRGWHSPSSMAFRGRSAGNLGAPANLLHLNRDRIWDEFSPGHVFRAGDLGYV